MPPLRGCIVNPHPLFSVQDPLYRPVRHTISNMQKKLNFAAVAVAVCWACRLAVVSAHGLSDPPVLGDGGQLQYLEGSWIAESVDGALQVEATVPGISSHVINYAIQLMPNSFPRPDSLLPRAGDLITDLERAGLVGDPLLKDNWREQAGVWQRPGGWRYFTTFVLSPALVRAASVQLVFDGVKMAADVYINNRLASGAAGLSNQHLRYAFDVTALLEPRSATIVHNLTVVFPLPSTDARNDEGRFMACSGGWDWAQYSTTTTPKGTHVSPSVFFFPL